MRNHLFFCPHFFDELHKKTRNPSDPADTLHGCDTSHEMRECERNMQIFLVEAKVMLDLWIYIV